MRQLNERTFRWRRATFIASRERNLCVGSSFYPRRRLFRSRVQYSEPVRSDVKRGLKSKCESNFQCYAQGKIRLCQLLRSICSRIKIAENSKNCYRRIVTIFHFLRYEYFDVINRRLASLALANFDGKIKISSTEKLYPAPVY